MNLHWRRSFRTGMLVAGLFLQAANTRAQVEPSRKSPGLIFTAFEFAISSIHASPQTVVLSELAGNMHHAASIKDRMLNSPATGSMPLQYNLVEVRFYAVRPKAPKQEWMAGFANTRLESGALFATGDVSVLPVQVDYVVQYFSVQSGWRYRFSPDRRFSWFAGVVGHAGWSVGAKTRLSEVFVPGTTEIDEELLSYRFFGSQARFFQIALQGGFYWQVFGRTGFSFQIQPGRIISDVDGSRYRSPATWTRVGIFVKLLE